MRTTVLATFMAATVAIGAAACGTASPTQPSGAAPRITAISPSQLVEAAGPQTLSVAGVNFLAGLTAILADPSGNSITLQAGDIQQVQSTGFQVNATLALPGSYVLQARNPTGETSDPFVFVVQATFGGQTPHLDTITPSSTSHGALMQTLFLSGSNLSAGMTITLIDPIGQLVNVTLTAVTSTSAQLSAVLSAVGTYQLYVTGISGDTSNSILIAVL